jgi:predicted Zn-dependent protease
MYRITRPALVLLLLSALAVAQRTPPLKPGFNLFTKQQDVQLGQELAAQVRQNATLVNDPVLVAYVNQVGKRLASTREASESDFTFTFEIVANPAINAYALPGGPMFINTGLLKAVDNEAQLAAAMGHEMSHVILRHGTNQVSKTNLIEIPLALAGQMADGDTLMGKLTQLGIGLGESGMVLKFSRSAESQADLMGSKLMAEAGYDPNQMAKFFEKLNATDGSAIEFLSDHPNPENRSRAIESEVRHWPQKTYDYQTGQFQKMKKEVATIHEPPPKPQEEKK